jgi:hypothetical protein
MSPLFLRALYCTVVLVMLACTAMAEDQASRRARGSSCPISAEMTVAALKNSTFPFLRMG